MRHRPASEYPAAPRRVEVSPVWTVGFVLISLLLLVGLLVNFYQLARLFDDRKSRIDLPPLVGRVIEVRPVGSTGEKNVRVEFRTEGRPRELTETVSAEAAPRYRIGKSAPVYSAPDHPTLRPPSGGANPDREGLPNPASRVPVRTPRLLPPVQRDPSPPHPAVARGQARRWTGRLANPRRTVSRSDRGGLGCRSRPPRELPRPRLPPSGSPARNSRCPAVERSGSGHRRIAVDGRDLIVQRPLLVESTERAGEVVKMGTWLQSFYLSAEELEEVEPVRLFRAGEGRPEYWYAWILPGGEVAAVDLTPFEEVRIELPRASHWDRVELLEDGVMVYVGNRPLRLYDSTLAVHPLPLYDMRKVAETATEIVFTSETQIAYCSPTSNWVSESVSDDIIHSVRLGEETVDAIGTGAWDQWSSWTNPDEVPIRIRKSDGVVLQSAFVNRPPKPVRKGWLKRIFGR